MTRLTYGRFIGSNFIRHMLEVHGDLSITNLDKLSYGSNPANLREIPEGSAYRFVRGDINDFDLVLKLTGDVKAVVNIIAGQQIPAAVFLSKASGKTHTVYGWDESEPATHKCINHFAIEHALGLQVPNLPEFRAGDAAQTQPALAIQPLQ